jgi:hypothetical protein
MLTLLLLEKLRVWGWNGAGRGAGKAGGVGSSGEAGSVSETTTIVGADPSLRSASEPTKAS